MYRIAGTVLVLLLAWPTLTDKGKSQDKTKKEPMSPAEQLKALVKEYQDTQQVWGKALRATKTDAERLKVTEELLQVEKKYAARFLDLAKKYPTDTAAVDTLLWVVDVNFGGGKDSPWGEALAILMRDHIKSHKLDHVCNIVGLARGKEAEEFLRAVLEKNPHRDVQGLACLALATHLKKQSRNDANLAREAEQLLQRAADRYADVKTTFRGTVGERAKCELFEMRSLVIGKVAPDIEGEDQDGKAFKLSDYRGRVVLLNFWGSWCGPCMALVPRERTLVKKLENKPFVLLGINSDESKDKLKKVITNKEMTWRSWFDGSNGPIATQWNVTLWPTLYVLDHKGVIRHKWVDSSGDKVLDEAIEKLVQEAEGGEKKESK
jgi:peroxiredoxin